MDDFNQNMTLYLNAIMEQLELLRGYINVLDSELKKTRPLISESGADAERQISAAPPE